MLGFICWGGGAEEEAGKLLLKMARILMLVKL